MTWHPAEDPKPGDARGCDAIETIIIPRARDLGSFEVRRALPSKERQMVGPFIFFDQMGPSEFILGQLAVGAGGLDNKTAMTLPLILLGFAQLRKRHADKDPGVGGSYWRATDRGCAFLRQQRGTLGVKRDHRLKVRCVSRLPVALEYVDDGFLGFDRAVLSPSTSCCSTRDTMAFLLPLARLSPLHA